MSRSSDQDFELPMPKRRRRPAKSCTPCRERKVKCDQQEPCGPCRKARATLTCIYKPEIWRVDSSIEQDHQQSSSLSKTIVQLQSRLAKLEKSTKHLGGEESTIRKALGDLEKRIADIEDNQGLVNCVHGGKSASPPALSVPPLTPYLRVTAEKSKLFDGNHWIHTAAKVFIIICILTFQKENLTLGGYLVCCWRYPAKPSRNQFAIKSRFRQGFKRRAENEIGY